MITSITMLNKYTKKIAVLLFWIIIWQVIAVLISSEIIIPTPISTLKALINISKDYEFYLAVLYSLLRILIGFLLGVIIGFFGGIMSYNSKLFSGIFSPILKIIKSVPVASFIILAFYWFKSDILPIFICFLMVLPMVWVSVETELGNIDIKYIELAKVYRLDNLKTFIKIKMPFILTSFLSTVFTALGFAWKSGIAAEVICQPDVSLGNMLQDSKIYISTSEVFAITTVVAVLSIILETVVKHTVRRFYNDKA